MFHGRDARSVVTAARLADTAYGDGEGDLAAQLRGTAPGWAPLGPAALGLPAGDFDTDGYYVQGGAAGFAAVQDGEVAIVFRGSDAGADLVEVAVGQSGYFGELRPLIQAAFSYAGTHDADHIVLAGHSLGGSMVQRTAAKLGTFDVPPGVTLEMTAFGPAGTDVGNETPASRSVLDVAHSGDPVPDSSLLDGLTQHGRFTTITLPNVEGAASLAELARQEATQKGDPSIATEHDIARYLLSAAAVASSPLAATTPDDGPVVVLDDRHGEARADSYGLDAANGLLLGLGGDDQLFGSGGTDRIDGGSGADLISGGASADLVTGGPGDDNLDGGAGRDTALFVSTSAQVEVRTYHGVGYAIAGAADGVDRLTGIERLQFADRVAALPADNFDALAYNASYRDLADAFGTDGAAGLSHYAYNGAGEGRSVTFDGLRYIACYGDLIDAFGVNRDAGSVHYIDYGRFEGRPADQFDAARYLGNYPDLQAAFGTDEHAATVHYITYGYHEGRSDEPLPMLVAGAGHADFLL